MSKPAAKEMLRIRYFFFLLLLLLAMISGPASADEIRLQDLIDEAMSKSPEVLASGYRAEASKFRIPQAKSLPDPMFMFGYQNEGWKQYTFGESLMSQWMFQGSQMFPFPGKLALKGEMASWESESLAQSLRSTRLKTVQRIKELYYDLFLAYKSIDLLEENTLLYSNIEDAAAARYSSGMGSQQEILMAQSEKYMLLEKKEMFRQKIQSTEAMLNTAVGRDVNAPLGRPAEPPETEYVYTLDELIRAAYENSPEVKEKEKMVSAADAKVRMAKKEYYPDFTITGAVMKKAGPFEDMWSLQAAFNVPIFYRTKQRQAVNEAEASLSQARSELQATRLMVSSGLRDNYSMLKTSERLMDLYKTGLIPKATQDFEAAIAGYTSGKIEAITVITRLKSLIDSELLYWQQFVEKEKAAARFTAMAGIMPVGVGGMK